MNEQTESLRHSGPGHAEAPTQARRPPGHRRRYTLALLCLAQFVLVLDITVVQVALPSIGADLALGRADVTWAVTTYLLFFGGLLILGGRLVDAFGSRRVALVGLGLFTVASLVCGLAVGGEMLLAGRAAQGAGAALLSPAALATLTTTFQGTERHRALGAWAAVGGSGAAVGVLVGGALTAGPGWQWAFLVNVPVGLFVGLALTRVVPADRTPQQRPRVDVLGAVAATSGTALVLYGLVQAGEGGWATAGTLLPIIAGGGCYLAFIAVERRARVPLVRPSLLIRRPVVSGAFVMLVGTGLMLGLFFLTSWYLQHDLGLGAMQTGLVFLPVAVAITAGAQLAGRLLATLGGRIVGTAGFVLAGTGAAALTQAPASGTPLLVVLPGFLVSAVGIGVTFVTATGTTLANVHHDEAGVASAVVSTFHELGGAIGVAVVSTVAVTSLVPGGSTSGFGAGYLTLAVAAGVAVLVVPMLVPPGKPARTVGHGH